MPRVTTHVLDTVMGKPASGMAVRLERSDGAPLANASTDADGRIRDWLPDGVPSGRYRLIFQTGPWFQYAGRETLYPEIIISFEVKGTGHYHVPLLLSPFGYSTYRGS